VEKNQSVRGSNG